MFENVNYAESNYENVVVISEGTEIKFKITVKGHSGFGFSIKSDRGYEIIKNLYA